MTPHKNALLAVFAVVSLVFASTQAPAIGLLVPTDRSCDPLELKSQVMKVEIDNQTAQTQIRQVFHNKYGRPIEATYLMPVPKGAHVTDFVMEMNGKKVHGEVLEKDKARSIYTDIVRRMRDPGLVEYVDQELFRARVFPIPPNGDQNVEITVTHLLEQDNGLVEYAWPFEPPKAVQQRGRPTSPDEFDLKLDIRSKVPVKSVYSPTHKVSVDREDNKHAVVRLDEQPQRDEPVFRCYYTLSKKAVGLNVLTTREEGKNGTFLLMISPGKFHEGDEAPPVDFTFVIDTSGSMNDDGKMEAAKKALSYCLGSLREKDAFRIIRFSTETEAFAKKFLEASPDNLKSARGFIKDLRPRGGTNIDEALSEALAQEPREDRLHTILFITDGKPTVGTTNVDQILKNLEQKNKKHLRVFACGVGYDVNTKLIDRLSEQTRSVAEYIRPKEDLEVAVGKLFDKISQPVLTNLKIDWGGLEVKQVYPKELPDLFAGTQLTVFGKYKNSGDHAITLTGKVGGDEKKYVYEATFREKEHKGHQFVETLWATRRVGYLLAQIRENGESKELRDEVVELAKKHGIVTPYTSYLVQEDDSHAVAMNRRGGRPIPAVVGAGDATIVTYGERGDRLRGGRGGGSGAAGRESGGFGGFGGTTDPDTGNLLTVTEPLTVDAPAEAPADSMGLSNEGEQRRRSFSAMRSEDLAEKARSSVRMATPRPGASLGTGQPGAGYRYSADGVVTGRDVSGQAAVEYSKGLDKLKVASSTEVLAGPAAGVKNVEGRMFQLVGKTWTEVRPEDQKKDEEKKRKSLKIKYMSDAYFELLQLRPDLKKIVAIGEQVTFDVNDYSVVIGPEGVEKLTDEHRTALKKK